MTLLNIQPKMVGRDVELKELEKYLDRAKKGLGNTVFIPGEAGVGKTRLVNELKEIAKAKGFQVLSGNSMYESLAPYMPFIDALRSGGLDHLFAEEAPRVESVYLMTHSGMLIKEVIRHESKLSPDIFASMLTGVSNFVNETLSILSGEEKEGSLNSLGYENYRILIESGKSANLVVILKGKENEFLLSDMKEILQKANKNYGSLLENWDGEDKRLKGIEEYLQPLITSGKYDGIYYGKEDPKARRNLLFENVSMGLIRQTQKTPTLLCLEDLHWADPSTLALIHYVARNTRKSGLLILGTFRPEDIAVTNGTGHPLINIMQLMNREDLQDEMELERLPKEDTAKFLSALLGTTEFSDEFQNRIYNETEGNPLFIIQLVKFLVEEKIIQTKNNVWKLTKSLEDINIPPKVYNVIERRLDRVEQEYRKVLDYASVIGETFSSNTLASALKLEKVRVLEQLRKIDHKHKLVHPEDGNYKFDHAKIKEVLYKQIPKDLRKEYHSLIADSIKEFNKDKLEDVDGELAFHYYNSRNKEKALLYLIKAADKAKKEYSNEEAIRFYNQALEFENVIQKRIGIFEVLGDICGLIGKYDDGIEFLRNAQELISERNKIAEIKGKIGAIYEYKGEYDEAIKICIGALNIIKDEEFLEKAQIFSTLGIVYERKSEYDHALKYLEKSLKIAEKQGDQRTVATCLNTIGFSVHFQGNFPKALEYLNRALPIWKDVGDQWGTLMCHKNIGATFSRMGDFDIALKHLSKALDIADKIGNQSGVIHCLGEMGYIYLDRTEWEKATDNYEKTLKIGNKTGDMWAIAASNAALSYMNIKKKRYDKVLPLLNKSTELAKAIDYKRGLGANYTMYGQYYLNKGDIEKAQESINQSLKLCKDFNIKEFLIRIQVIQGMIFREQKKWDNSIETFENCIDMLNKLGIKCYDLGDAYYQFALMWKAKGETEKTKLYLNKALDVSEQLKIKEMVKEVKATLSSL